MVGAARRRRARRRRPRACARAAAARSCSRRGSPRRARGDLQARLVGGGGGDAGVRAERQRDRLAARPRRAVGRHARRRASPARSRVISQSGNVAVNALASRRGLRPAHGRLVRQPGGARRRRLPRRGAPSATACGRVALYLEDDGDGERWCAALERCARAGVGVAVLKAGHVARRARAAADAHTGALAGDQRVFRALFEECGAAWAEDPHDLLEIAKALGAGRGARRRDRGDAAGGEASAVDDAAPGGDSAIAADLAAELGVDAARARARDRRAARARRCPHAATAANPLDYTSLLWDDARRAARADRGARRRPGGRAGARAVRRVRRARADPRRGRRAPTCPARLDAARAVPATARIAGLRSALLAAKALPTTPDPERIAAIGAARRARRRRRGSRSTRRRRCCGTPASRSSPGWRVSDETPRSPPGASSAAPVALKRTGAAPQGRATAAWSSTSTTSIARRAGLPRGSAAPCSSSGWPRRGTELLVAVRRDGIVPVLVVGLGGVHTELLDDVAIVPLPVDAARVDARRCSTLARRRHRRRRDARHQARRRCRSH